MCIWITVFRFRRDCRTSVSPCSPSDSGECRRKALTISGSTTVLPIAAAVAEAYMAKNPDIDVKVSGGGSGAGISAIGKGSVDIGMSSRALNTDEKASYSKLIATPVVKMELPSL
ncbi:substrate-binding domain-containing protein [Methanospirillum sp.]|uniref:substrate-binding domain-containing protein n=1 Tax=Methanospirillum sp. TaxID=45200 RepID=UPI00261CD06A|nr:substrate-binding domain-containing protein [Methanospirillum sp.]